MDRLLALLCTLLLVQSCSRTGNEQPPERTALEFRSADISFLPEIRKSGAVIFNSEGKPQDMLTIMQDEGLNVARLRIWNEPTGVHSTLKEVSDLAVEMRVKGIKVWITLHYSDWWADPGKQNKPAAWQNLKFDELKERVYQFTRQVMLEVRPDYIQIGNEINNGFLWPDGHINNPDKMKALLHEGIRAVRETNVNTKVMLHYAGHHGAKTFFEMCKEMDFDLIGVSYYPFWHGTSLDSLKNNLALLHETFRKKIVIAETAYPFTLQWNDKTNNVIGEKWQIHPEYPPTPQGQLDFLLKIKDIARNTPGGAGFCYWAPEWISMYGKESKSGSSWENQALWGFDNKELPGMKVFN
jgi:arabinogalactan endo-1,4-beta-galactosidase